MNIKLNNIAKVAEAEIRVDGVSVIGGYNDTGKSTVLKSIYMAANLFRNAEQKVREERRNSLFSAVANQASYFESRTQAFGHSMFVYDFADAFSKAWEKSGDGSFETFRKTFLECLANSTESSGQAFGDEKEVDRYLRPVFEKVEEVLKRPRETYMRYIGDMYIKNVFSSQMNHMNSGAKAKIEVSSENTTDFLEVEDNKIVNMSYHSVLKPDAIYLPTYNVLDMINDHAPWIRIRSRNRYSMEDELGRYLVSERGNEQTFEAYSEREANISAIKDILKEVAHGELQTEENGKLTFKDDGLDKTIDIGNVASGMKTFLVIQKLVENGYLKRNDILLIDEPETNLHPEWHLKFAEIIVLMYKHMGISTVANSHSPYFIRAIEVKLADHGMKRNGNFYLMEKRENGRCYLNNVTDQTDALYRKLYMPMNKITAAFGGRTEKQI